MATQSTTVQIVMPAMGESVTEGTVLEWLKQVGDTVAEGDAVVEISTDKVDAEVSAPAAGVLLKIAVEPDQTVKVGQVLAEIEAGGPPAEVSRTTDLRALAVGRARGRDDSRDGRFRRRGHDPRVAGQAR